MTMATMGSAAVHLLPLLLMLLLLLLPIVMCSAHRQVGLRFLIDDRESKCSAPCVGALPKPLCASNGRTYESRCEFQRAKCKEPQLEVTRRGRCPEMSSCQQDRARAQERQDKNSFIPECKEDGTYAEVQCHSSTGYCWCVTSEGRPISGTSVRNTLPKCTGVERNRGSQARSTAHEKPGKEEDGSRPTPTSESQLPLEEEETISGPTIWRNHLQRGREMKPNGTAHRSPDKNPSCDQERQIATEEVRKNPREGIFVPECAAGGVYRAVQCHQSTGYCWCVYVDTGRPIPGTSARYKLPECDGNARARSKLEDPFRDRELEGCPGVKKNEFVTSLLDALTTDMVNAINSKTAGRFSEPNPSHTLEERVVHWYFGTLDLDEDERVDRRENKPLKRLAKRKGKPRRCSRKLVEHCDLNSDKVISLAEMKGCLGVRRDEGYSSHARLADRRFGSNSFCLTQRAPAPALPPLGPKPLSCEGDVHSE
ncbi:SPARC-related modular calcium-binding protein 1 isoform X2 [Lampetra planeri]